MKSIEVQLTENEQLWYDRIKDCYNSDISVADYVRKNHISGTAFYHWKRKFHQGGVIKKSLL